MSGRQIARTHHDCLTQINSTVQTLEYWKRQCRDDRAFYIQMAILNLERAAKDIYDKELSGVARL